jgi:hypothetical protein
MRHILFACFLLLVTSCEQAVQNQLHVSADKVALRATPGVKGAEVGTLLKGEKLTELAEVSHFETEITWGQASILAPWLKVETSRGKQGWVHAGAVTPTGDKGEWLLQKRLDCYFGHAFTSRINDWKAGISNIKTDAACALSYRTAIGLRDSMVQSLVYRPEVNGRPEYLWLPDVLPGFVYQRAYSGVRPNLFADYRFWAQIAQQTNGAADNLFFETCSMAFPRDSIESLFPVWKFELPEQESASQLGTGAHMLILQQLDKNLAQSRLFEPELMGMKEALLEDIQDKNTRFWQSGELILKELDEIMARKPACLSEQESSALLPRRVMLEAAAENGVKVNLRSGE